MSPMSDFLPFHFPSPSLLPCSAFGITILSESFIYPFSSFIPLPIISSSLPSMTHSPIRPIHLPALFLHHRCLFRQPISPSSVLLPSISSLISFAIIRAQQTPFLFGPGTENQAIIGYFFGHICSYAVPHCHCLP